MPFQIIRNDITRVSADAIVNAANASLLGGGGVDGAIHRAAGPELLAECRTLGGCPTGQARITGGYNLPCKYVIHTVGPIWQGGLSGERAALEASYRSSLALAQQHGCETVAFPLISAGAYGYPYEQALAVAKESILRFLQDCENMTVYLVLYGWQRTSSNQYRLARLDQFLQRHFEPPVFAAPMAMSAPKPEPSKKRRFVSLFHPKEESAKCEQEAVYASPSLGEPLSLEELLGQIDESFSEMVKRKIAELGITNAECYKRANIDKKLFSKINNDPHYHPKKPTAVALAVALRLDMDETRELLSKAGFALSRSDKFDIIIEYFISTRNYDIFEINDALFDYDQPLLGNSLL